MADVVRKMVQAVIDRRTTVVCLHAAGQVRPVDQPFDTLLGPQDSPPFHVHCRSQSVPWMDGFDSGIRAEANAELASRPPGAARHLPPRPHDPPTAGSLAPRPSGPPPLPPGTAAIDKVPPTQVKAWLEAHPDRFEITSNGGGISETYWVRDVTTGQRFVLKKGQYNAESINEIAGTRFDAQIGLPGVARVAGDMADGNGWLLLDHAEDVMPGYKVVGTGGGHPQIAKMAGRLEDPRDAVRVLLGDFVRDEADAKGGNMLLLSKDGGKTVRLVPIDRSLGMMGWRNAVEPGKTSIVAGDWSLDGRLKVADLRQYMKTRGSPKGVLEMVRGMDDALVVKTYDEVLAAMKAVNLDDVFTGLEGHAAAEARALMEHRIALLETKRSVLLKQMGVTADVDTPVVRTGKIVPKTWTEAEYKARYDAWEATWSGDMATSLAHGGYVGGGSHLNFALRSGAEVNKGTAQMIDDFDRFFRTHAVPLEDDLMVRRGLYVTPGFDPEQVFTGLAEKGEFFVDAGWTSTTVSERLMDGSYAGQWQVDIAVPKGTEVVYGGAAMWEVVLDRNVAFRVLGIDRETHRIALEVVR